MVFTYRVAAGSCSYREFLSNNVLFDEFMIRNIVIGRGLIKVLVFDQGIPLPRVSLTR